MREQVIRNIQEEFLGTAFRYLVDSGLENTSIRDLCKAMGISSGSLYYWFDGKDDVYINAVKYGLSKVTASIFDFVFSHIGDLENMFALFLDEIDKHKQEMRLIFQMTASPVYGDRIREKALEEQENYKEYLAQLCETLSGTPDDWAPVVFMISSTILDYVLWDDRAFSETQMHFLYEMMKTKAQELKK
ncbi:MAG: TetR/AcrR family transcriptional regulator [Ruminococcaceae bacterium]|nr:TetR/AcrR family transcriptional regulator [Oscillospiraceae bacterium]